MLLHLPASFPPVCAGAVVRANDRCPAECLREQWPSLTALPRLSPRCQRRNPPRSLHQHLAVLNSVGREAKVYSSWSGSFGSVEGQRIDNDWAGKWRERGKRRDEATLSRVRDRAKTHSMIQTVWKVKWKMWKMWSLGIAFQTASSCGYMAKRRLSSLGLSITYCATVQRPKTHTNP